MTKPWRWPQPTSCAESRAANPSTVTALLPGELPQTYLEEDPWRMYLVAAALLCQLRTADAAGWLQRLTRSLPDTPETAMLRVRAEMLWIIHDGLRWDGAGVLEHYERVNDQVGLSGHLNLNVPPAVAVSHEWVGSLDAAVADLLPQVVAWAHLWLGQLRPSPYHCERSNTKQELGRQRGLFGLEGHPRLSGRAATRRLRPGPKSARRSRSRQGADALSTLAARLTLAAVHRERNELDAAQQLLTDGLDGCQQKGQARWAAALRCELIQVVVAQGRHLDGLDRLGQLRHVDADDPLPECLRRKLDRVEIHCRLALGDLEGALLILNSVPTALHRDEILARLDLCAGRPDRAEQRLTAAADRARPMRAEIERLVLLARAQLQLGKAAGADDALRRAVERGRPDRYIRVFLDDADHLLDRLRGIAGRYPDTYLSELVDRAHPAVPFWNGEAPGQIVEPLTGRERDLLAHLPTHLRQREIAATMYVSVNTVKTHTAAVYRKLGAASRSQAVQTARLHGLL